MDESTQESGVCSEHCDRAEPRHYHHPATTTGPIWLIGWLFTIGLLRLPFFWKGVLALVLWPYYLGSHLSLRSGAGIP